MSSENEGKREHDQSHTHARWYRCRRWILLAPLIPVAIAAMIAAKSAIVMVIWNALIPDLFHGPLITFPQAIGLSILVKLLVGFGGGHGWRGRHGWHRHGHWRKKRARWLAMSPQEREKLRQHMKNHFGGEE